MCGSNVVRLRRCLSAIQHRRCIARRYNSGLAAATPISREEFLKALGAVYPQREWGNRSKLGLAISGGVDSMALASLYSTAHRDNKDLPIPYGIIVDHKARPESTEEAKWVAEELRSKLDMDSSIISLTWPKDFDFENTKRFETEARALRYQAIGRECMEKNISSLMVAHHANDQAETLIIRMIKSRLRSGLQGMQPVEWIPECHGIYGVHHSGGIKSEQEIKAEAKLPLPIESGGIQILRPLLGFEKSRLIASCKDQGVTWAEDKTNQDPTLTLRNAIRHIMQNHKLPAALSQTSLAQLARHMQSRVKSHQRIAQKILNKTLLNMDIQTGSVVIRFPSSTDLLEGNPIKTEADQHAARNTAYLFLQRITEMVNSSKTSSTGQLSRAVDNIWPTLRIEEQDGEAKNEMRDSFTTNKIWFRVWDKPSPFSKFPYHNDMEWLLTRQPVEHGENDDISITIPSGSTPYPSKGIWHLFDNRFWIRIVNKSANDLVVRYVTHTDISNISQIKGVTRDAVSQTRSLKAVFNLLKPVDLRYTIPGIFQRSVHKGKPDRLVSLPTFKVFLDFPGDLSISSICHFDIHYHKIDTGKRTARSFVSGAGLSNGMLRNEGRRIVNEWQGKQRASFKDYDTPPRRLEKGLLKDMLQEEDGVLESRVTMMRDRL